MILLIDGSSLLSTNYFATLPKSIMFEKDPEKRAGMYSQIMHSKDGIYTNGIFGFMRALTGMINKQKPTHLFIAFDKTRDTFRKRLYPEYKGQRKEAQGPLREQFLVLEIMLQACGFAVAYGDEYEADDYVGSATEKFKGTWSIRIWSKDQDYFQLVDDEHDIRLWMPFEKEKLKEMNEAYRGVYGYDEKIQYNIPNGVFEFTEETVKAYFGVRPDQVADYKGIAGDTSDNIPGIRGVSSAAVPLLEEYGSLEAIYEEIDACVGDRKMEKALKEFWKNDLGIARSPFNAMIEHREMGFLSKNLAMIRRDCRIGYSLMDLSVEDISYEKLNVWYAGLGMKSLINQINYNI